MVHTVITVDQYAAPSGTELATAQICCTSSVSSTIFLLTACEWHTQLHLSAKAEKTDASFHLGAKA